MHSHLKDADVIVSAVGQPGLVTKDDVKEGAVIVDVGNTPDENGKLKGDVEFEEVKEVACNYASSRWCWPINNYYGA